MVIDQVAENSNPLEFSIPAAVGENDVVGAVFQKFVSLSQRQDRVEYAGGIWDNTAMDMLPSVPVAAETRNSMNRIFSLEEMIECEEEMDGNTSLKIEESPNMACNFLMSNDSSSPVQIPDTKIKRSMSSEGENILFPKIDAERKANKKRTKKAVTFSDNIVIYKDSLQKISSNTDVSGLCSEEVEMSNTACDPKQNLNFEKPKKSDNRRKLTSQSNGLSSSLHQHSVQIQSTDKIRLELKETKKESNKESCAVQHNQNFPISEKEESSLNHPNSVISKPFKKEKENESIENIQVSHKEAKKKKKKVPHEKTIHDSISVIEPVKIKLQSKTISSSTEQFHVGKKSDDESQNKTFNKDQHPNCWENLVSYLFNNDSETNKKIASCKSPVKMTKKDILNDKTMQDNEVIIEQASFHSETDSEPTSARKSRVKRGQSRDVNVDFLEKKKVDVHIVDDSSRKHDAGETVNWRNHQPSGELNQKDFVSSKSKSLNWREDCIDVRKARKNSNFRADDNIMMDNSKEFSHIISDEKVDVHKKTPNFIPCSKELLDPLTRFKNNALPESIWDEPVLKIHEKPVKEDPPALPKSKNSIPIFYESSKKLLQKNEKEKQQLPAKKLYYSESTKFDNRARSSYCSYINSSAMKDVKVIVKIFNQDDVVIEKFHVLKDDFHNAGKEIWGLSNIVPDPCNKPKKIHYSVSSVNLFLRCVFSMSYRIPNWQTALEAFAIAKTFKVHDLESTCQMYFINQKIPTREIPALARFAKSLKAVEALKESKIFEQVQDIAKNISSLDFCAAGNCSVSTAIHVEPSEFSVPLVFEDVKSLAVINNSDLKNTILFKSISSAIRVMSIELKLRTEEFSVGNQDLIIYCDVYKGSHLLFNEEFYEKPKSVLKISFEEGLVVEEEQEIEITVLVENISLQLCPQLDKDDYSSRKFHLKFRSDQKNENKKLFFIDKLHYIHEGF